MLRKARSCRRQTLAFFPRRQPNSLFGNPVCLRTPKFLGLSRGQKPAIPPWGARKRAKHRRVHALYTKTYIYIYIYVCAETEPTERSCGWVAHVSRGGPFHRSCHRHAGCLFLRAAAIFSCTGAAYPPQKKAMGQNPVPKSSEHPNPTTNIGSKMGGAPTPK